MPLLSEVKLPTYTSIWRIEKRLYKLYDFRLPMPLPVGQIIVFTAITLPYVILLTLFGLPFTHSLFWLYVLPPGVLTWLATRPVLESKRLPELIISQVRYLGEPPTWCRMAPLAEKDEIAVSGRVWRRAAVRPGVPERQPATASQRASELAAFLPQALIPISGSTGTALTRAPKSQVSAGIRTLIRKTDPHQKCASSRLAKTNHIGVADQLQFTVGGMQVPYQRGQGDVQDGVVEVHDEQL